MRQVVPIETLITGYGAALGRFYAQDHQLGQWQSSPHRAFLSLFEALNWAVAIDDRLRIDRSEDWQDELDGGVVVRAVRFARNRVHHQWAAALVGSDSGHYSIDRGDYEYGGSSMWGWREELPEPESERHRDPKGEALYREHLAGRPVGPSLDRLNRLFMALRDDAD